MHLNRLPRVRAFVSAFALAGALASASAAHAQDAAAPQSASGQAQAANDTINSANDIVVTAQFKAQSVQSTPIAISALNSKMLEQKGVTDIAGAANLAPNVAFTKNAGNFGGIAAIFIRGVGQADPHFAVEPGVGMYVDDVYFGVLTGSIFELLDTDRVEVLRGPQGTLAGKNSIGGSVKLFSKRPGPDTDGFIEAGYGSRNTIVARGATNVTLDHDHLWARFSFGSKTSDGYMKQLDYACATGGSGTTIRTDTSCVIGHQGGVKVWSARGELLWKPVPGIEDLLIADVTRDRSENPAAQQLVQSPLWAGTANYVTPFGSYFNYQTQLSLPTGGSQAGNPFIMPSQTPIDARGASNNLTIQLGDGLSLTSITAYRASKATFSSSEDATPTSNNDQVWTLDHHQFTQELRLSGRVGSLLDFTLGGFYYDAWGSSGGRVNIPGGLALGGGGLNLDILFHDPVRTTSKSAFVHTVWHPTEALSVIAAGRYTRDRKTFTFNRLDPNGQPHPLLGALTNLPVTYSGDRWDYRLGINYEWSKAFMTYAQVATGYKGGGVNPRPFFVTQAVPYPPETLTSYEAGFKSRFWDRRATFNVAAFHNVYKNFQATVTSCDAISPFPGAPCAQTTNVGDARMNGIEGELSLEPVPGLNFDASVGYLDFKYTRANPASGITLAMTNVFSPKWTAAAGVQYAIPMGAIGTLTPRFDLSYRSAIQTNAINDAISALPPLTLLNAKLTWKNTSDDWQAEVAVTNLTNKYYYNSVFSLAGPPYFTAVGNVGQPRTVLFTIRRNFR